MILSSGLFHNVILAPFRSRVSLTTPSNNENVPPEKKRLTQVLFTVLLFLNKAALLLNFSMVYFLQGHCLVQLTGCYLRWPIRFLEIMISSRTF